MFRTLRQPRYGALGVLMLVVAIVCVAAGTWQISRFEQKRHENDYLRTNAHRASTAVAAVLPIVGQGKSPSSRSIEFRQVRATGTYDAQHQSLVRGRSVGDLNGFLVLTPLRTSGATLLVVRGFIAQPSSGGAPALPTPPSGQVTVVARTQSSETRSDDASLLTSGQVESINAGQQARRLGTDVYDGYAQLEANQPGTRGLHALPRPNLSNPAGGALEPQHFAYIIQWYLFALLALAAPFAMARAETKHKVEREFDAVPDEILSEPTPEDLRAAKLADRYGTAVRR